ncbi:hypothetical protein MKEN_00941100 [Mycena kentingensis (nom. inval.)]|nr:hypothetical protein MKEN_00941100 [Mycena kentingensis (nom. inval.)]
MAATPLCAQCAWKTQGQPTMSTGKTSKKCGTCGKWFTGVPNPPSWPHQAVPVFAHWPPVPSHAMGMGLMYAQHPGQWAHPLSAQPMIMTPPASSGASFTFAHSGTPVHVPSPAPPTPLAESDARPTKRQRTNDATPTSTPTPSPAPVAVPVPMHYPPPYAHPYAYHPLGHAPYPYPSPVHQPAVAIPYTNHSSPPPTPTKYQALSLLLRDLSVLLRTPHDSREYHFVGTVTLIAEVFYGDGEDGDTEKELKRLGDSVRRVASEAVARAGVHVSVGSLIMTTLPASGASEPTALTTAASAAGLNFLPQASPTSPIASAPPALPPPTPMAPVGPCLHCTHTLEIQVTRVSREELARVWPWKRADRAGTVPVPGATQATSAATAATARAKAGAKGNGRGKGEPGAERIVVGLKHAPGPVHRPRTNVAASAAALGTAKPKVKRKAPDDTPATNGKHTPTDTPTMPTMNGSVNAKSPANATPSTMSNHTSPATSKPLTTPTPATSVLTPAASVHAPSASIPTPSASLPTPATSLPTPAPTHIIPPQPVTSATPALPAPIPVRDPTTVPGPTKFRGFRQWVAGGAGSGAGSRARAAAAASATTPVTSNAAPPAVKTTASRARKSSAKAKTKATKDEEIPMEIDELADDSDEQPKVIEVRRSPRKSTGKK